jgi:hypothetical protein
LRRLVLARRLLLLVEEREIVLVELREPVVPGDVLERVLAGAARKSIRR